MTSTAPFRRASAPRRRHLPAVLLASLPLLALQPALAKQDDRQQPIDVHANSSSAYNQPNSMSKLIGNVVITQGTMKGTGDHANMYTDADTQISRVVLFSSPQKQAHIQQLDDNDQLMTGDADVIDYDNINGIAVLTGNASVHQQGRGESHGDKLTYNTNTSQMTGEANSGGQVHMIFLPKPKPAAATPPAKPGTPAPKAATTPAHSGTTPVPAANPPENP
ncbi:MAG: lipopolysaccharide transport periplasmic protein LptA [Dyella sp.]